MSHFQVLKTLKYTPLTISPDCMFDATALCKSTVIACADDRHAFTQLQECEFTRTVRKTKHAPGFGGLQ